MATMFEVPLEPGLADRKLDISLEDKTFTLHITWNEYAGYWYLSLFHRSGQAIVTNIKMVKNVLLLKRYRLDALKGDFIFFDNNSGKTRPDFDSLGGDHLLLYRKP